jgi:hypothetical protein
MQWVTLGTRLLPFIVMAVQAVEKLAGAKKGQEKQDAAIELIGHGLNAVEAGLEKDVIDVPEVQDAMRDAISAYVKLQNAIAKAKAA